MFIFWCLVETLLMESGLFRDLFGNFSTQGERCYFCMEGSMRGQIETKNQKTWNSEKLKFLFWVEGTFGGCRGVCKLRYARWGIWGGVCEVRYARWDLCEVGYARWDLHEVRFTWGEIYTWWDLHEVRFTQGGICEMTFMWGGICEVRFTWGRICEVRFMQGGIHEMRFTWGEINARWDLHEVRFTGGGISKVRLLRGEIYASHLVKIFHSFIFHLWFELYVIFYPPLSSDHISIHFEFDVQLNFWMETSSTLQQKD